MNEAEESIDTDLRDEVLHRLGLDRAPDISPSGLTRLYVGWLQNIPFCSSHKRLHYADDVNRPGPLPLMLASEYFDAFLKNGTGGTCFPTAEAWYQLLQACGFEVRRAIGSMLEFEHIPGPNHGTVLVRFGGDEFLVDPFFGSEQPLSLSGAPRKVGRKSLEIESVADRDRGLPEILWRFHTSRQKMRFGFSVDFPTVDHALFSKRYEASSGANSVFNASLYVSVHRDEDVHTIFKNEYFILRPDNRIDRRAVGADRDQLLSEIFGLSPSFARTIPADLPE